MVIDSSYVITTIYVENLYTHIPPTFNEFPNANVYFYSTPYHIRTTKRLMY